MPFLSHYIEPAGYGVLSVFNTYVLILSPVMSVVSYSLITVEYYKMNDRTEFSKLFSSIQFIPLAGFLFFLLPSLLFNSQLSSLLELEYRNGLWLILLPVCSLMVTYNEVFLSYLVIQKRPVYYATISIIRSIIEISLTYLFVAVFAWGWEGRLYGWMIAIVFLFIQGFFYVRHKQVLKFTIDPKYIRAGLIFGFPLLLHTIGKFIINQSDRIFIAKMISIDEAGIYNVGYQVGSIILILVTAFGSSYTPFLYERLSNPSQAKKKEIIKTSLGFVVFLLIALTVMTLLTPWFFRVFMDESYVSGTKYVFWTGLAYCFWGVYMIFAGYLFFFKKTKFLAFLAVFNVIVNIVLNYILIKEWGALGAAYATAISFFLVMLLVVMKAQKVYPMNFFTSLKKEKTDRQEHKTGFGTMRNGTEKKISVLHIIETIGIGGGTEVLLANTVNNLHQCRNIVVTLYPYHKEYDLGEVPVYHLNIKSWFSFAASVFKLRKLAKENDVDIIHAHLFWSVLLARLAKPKGVKLAVSIHSLLSIDLFKKKTTILLEKALMNRQDAVIAVSKAVLDDYVKETGFKKQQFVLYNFVPDYFFDNPVTHNCAKEKRNCIAVGHFKPTKNYGYLIRSLKDFSSTEVQLDLYGEGPLHKEMSDQIIREKAEAVHIAGLTDNMNKVLRQYRIFISASEYEGFGIALVEAMAAGLVCIVSDIPVFREVAGDACLFIDINDPDSLKNVLRKIMNNEIDMKALAEKGRKRAYEISNMSNYLKDLQKIYGEILS